VQDGTPFGRYRLIEVIGRSEVGETWRLSTPSRNAMSP